MIFNTRTDRRGRRHCGAVYYIPDLSGLSCHTSCTYASSLELSEQRGHPHMLGALVISHRTDHVKASGGFFVRTTSLSSA